MCICVCYSVDEHRLQYGTIVQNRLQQGTGRELLTLNCPANGVTLLQQLLLLRILVAQHRVKDAGELTGKLDGGHCAVVVWECVLRMSIYPWYVSLVHLDTNDR